MDFLKNKLKSNIQFLFYYTLHSSTCIFFSSHILIIYKCHLKSLYAVIPASDHMGAVRSTAVTKEEKGKMWLQSRLETNDLQSRVVRGVKSGQGAPQSGGHVFPT